MLLKRRPVAFTVAVAVIALLLAVDPASAAPRGGSYRGGSRVYYGGRSGYYGGRGDYYRGSYGYYRPGIGIGLGLGAYPYYYNGYSAPVVEYSSPSYYYSPPTTIVTQTPTIDPDVAPAAYERADDRAHLEVRVPAPDAQVLFDGDPTQQRGMDRVFVSPPLTPGKTFTYTIQAQWMENGRKVEQSRSAAVSAGQTAVVDFTR